MTTTATPAPRKKRVRLSPQVRRQQILDAALLEFAAHGFGATSVEKIAQRVGLSKAGLYAHFASKDEIFEALLASELTPSFSGRQWLEQGRTLREAVDLFIDATYARVGDARSDAMMRLLIAEHERASSLLQRWRDEIYRPYIDEQQRIVDDYVERGLMRRCALTRHFALIMAPALFASISRMLSPAGDAQREVEAVRETHRALLRELVQDP